jgi:nucleolar pre-ribosomal-associated protein 2
VSSLSSRNRRFFFDAVASAVDQTGFPQDSFFCVGYFADSKLKTQFFEAWNGFLSTEWLLKAPSVVSELANIFAQQLNEASSSLRLLLSSLLNLPVQLVPRHQRGMLLDLLQQILLDRKQGSPDIDVGILTLMTRLAQMPKSPARIMSDWEVLWRLACSIRLCRADDSDMLIFRSFRQLQRAVVDQVLVSSDVDRQKYFRKTYEKLSAVLETKSYDPMIFFMLRISLSSLHMHVRELQGCFEVEDLNALRVRVFDTVVSDLRSFRKKRAKQAEDSSDRDLEVILNNLEDFEDLASASRDVQKSLRKIQRNMSTTNYSIRAKKALARRILATQKTGKEMVSSLTQWTSLFPVNQLHKEEQCTFFGEFRERLSRMTPENLTLFVHDLREAGFSGEHASHRALLAGIAVSCFGPVENRDSAASVELSSLFTAISESLPDSLSMESFCIEAKCLEALLRTQTRSISQWNIDNIMGSISVTLSRSGPQIAPECGGAIYTSLCRLLGMLFGQYRQKLSGRFHLILPVMQRLLRCLFTPDTRPSKFARNVSVRPEWVQDGRKCVLQVEHASQYTRLLTSLCDPTVSTVQQQRGTHKQLGLNDNTKKVKRLAGQYLQYLVVEYAGCQLGGAIVPEMKAALMPGMYAILDVMSRDTVRAMNAAMDSPSRAVFKGLYADYVRFGKWNHD